MLKSKLAQRKIDSGNTAHQILSDREHAVARLDKDLAEVRAEQKANTQLIQSEKNLLEFQFVLMPNRGYWKDGKFVFRINVPENYPATAPTVVYTGPNRIYHPNIEGEAGKTEWGVCTSIKRDDWKPVLGMKEFLFGIAYIFDAPNVDDFLCPDAAKLLREDTKGFQAKVSQYMRGKYS